MSRIHNIPTKKIKEILSNYGTRSDVGTDFEHMRDELRQELWKRQEKGNERLIKRSIVKYEREVR